MAGKLKFRSVFDYEDDSDLEDRNKSNSKHKPNTFQSESIYKSARNHKNSEQTASNTCSNNLQPVQLHSKRSIHGRKRGLSDVFDVGYNSEEGEFESAPLPRTDRVINGSIKPGEPIPLTRRSSEGRTLNWRSNSESSDIRAPDISHPIHQACQLKPPRRAVSNVQEAILLFEYQATLKRSVGKVG